MIIIITNNNNNKNNNREVPSLTPRSKSCPADLYLPYWKRGQPAALDVSVISPLRQLTVTQASIVQGYAVSVGEDRKMAAHAAPCKSFGVFFIPLIVETHGVMKLLTLLQV